jgi:hypothetical protein
MRSRGVGFLGERYSMVVETGERKPEYRQSRDAYLDLHPDINPVVATYIQTGRGGGTVG